MYSNFYSKDFSIKRSFWFSLFLLVISYSTFAGDNLPVRSGSSEIANIGEVEKLRRGFIESLRQDTVDGYLPSPEDIENLERKYGLSWPYTATDVYSAVEDKLKEIYVPRSFDEYDHYLMVPNVKKIDALKKLNAIRDRFDLVQGMRMRSFQDSSPYQNAEEVVQDMSNARRAGTTELQQITPNEQMKSAVRAFVSEKNTTGTSSSWLSQSEIDRLLNKAFVQIDGAVEIMPSQVRLLNMMFHLIDSPIYNKGLMLDLQEVDLSKTLQVALTTADPDIAIKNMITTTKIYTLANRASLLWFTDFLLNSKLFPYKLSFGRGGMDNFTNPDFSEYKSFFYDMVLTSKDLEANKELASIYSQALEGYLKTVRESVMENTNTMVFSKERSVVKDVHALIKHVKRAVMSGRKVEMDVLSEAFRNKNFIVSFNTQFLDYGLEYILPRLKEGFNAKEIVDTMVSKLSEVSALGTFTGTHFTSWTYMGEEVLLHSKKDLIWNALGKYMSRTRHLALPFSSIARRLLPSKAAAGMLRQDQKSLSCSGLLKKLVQMP